MKNRIKNLRKELNLTQQEFADKIGISRGNIGAYEVGKNVPSDAVISLICREFNVREKWLRNGEGEMFNPKSYDMLDQLTDKYNLSTTDRAVIDKFLSMDPKVRKEMLDYFYNFVAVLTHETEPLQPMDNLVDSFKKLTTETAVSEMSVEDAETEYKKSRSGTVRKTASSASSITREGRKDKASNQ